VLAFGLGTFWADKFLIRLEGFNILGPHNGPEILSKCIKFYYTSPLEKIWWAKF
jgi:hypothetical protein